MLGRDTKTALTAELLQVVSLLLNLLSSLSQQRLHLVRQQSVQLQLQSVDFNNLKSTNYGQKPKIICINLGLKKKYQS